jgi:DNA-binding response OmpR family regulator
MADIDILATPSFAGCSVLVVEDEPVIALDLRQGFEAAGAYVFAATQLAHALTLAQHPDLSVAVLDYRIDDENCALICRRLEERGVPFLFYSGYDDMHRQRPEAVVVSKPASIRTIVDAAANLLEEQPHNKRPLTHRRSSSDFRGHLRSVRGNLQ